MKLDGQVGVSKKAHKIMTAISSTNDDQKPFNEMADAYLFAFVLGLTSGGKKEVNERKNYANFSTIENAAGSDDFDFVQLLTHLGSSSDTASKEEAMKAIEEYATWGFLKIAEYDRGDCDYRIGELLTEMIPDSDKK